MTDVEQREVRPALVMTGGVSLAVWMGGVAGALGIHLLARSAANRSRPGSWR